ncbi:MAG: Transcription-repair coupling factor [uncultured Acidimicrobiales bacterium]|uniref:Transcription-repair-coupling factor n=1 Tax=uncultured Acidimicrobiales bacterium TaxID=310071 RepID=A0A6J4ICJ8_9ACTN|nr:MAG: Transcription-repair coupling factor [uncultured Acidimicrobiales bacterium]
MALDRLLSNGFDLAPLIPPADAPGAVLSVPDAARPYVVAGLARLGHGRPVVAVTPTQADAEHLSHDVAAFLGRDEVVTFPAWETLPFERVSPAVETMGRRLEAVWRLRHDPPKVLVAAVRALVQRLGPHVEDAEPVWIRPGDRLDVDALLPRLVRMGYRREHQVEHRGEVAVRGSIIDVFASTADIPIRIDLWGDEVDRLTAFDVADQRSKQDLDQAWIFGARELVPTDEVRARARALVDSEPWGREQWERLSEGLLFEGMESWLPWLTRQAGSGVPEQHVLADLLPEPSLVVLFEPRRVRERAAEVLDEEQALAASLATTWSVPGGDLPRLHIPFERLLAHTTAPVWAVSSVPAPPGGSRSDVTAVDASAWESMAGDPTGLVRRIERLRADGFRIVVAADGAGSADRLARSLADAGITAPRRGLDDPALSVPGISVVVQALDRGFVLPGLKLAVLAEPDLTGRRSAHRKSRPRPRPTEGFFDALEPGDHVVHHHHGVGRYKGMVRRALMGGPERDYLLIEYRDGSLHLPSDQIDLIRPYSGGEQPSLNRMGGSDWSKTKARVRSAAMEIAQELVVLYQRRLQSPGFAFSPDTPWQQELEDAFPFTETADQQKAIAEVKADMEEPRPMDRLVCGDVGFGKTEVAIRAAMKAVQDGKQVCVLVPTTLLANQHHVTFSDRFAGFPVRVEVFSRFLTPTQARKVQQALAAGEVDIVIGTHKLLAKEVTFKDLGLLVIDEEQRFGVTSKEQIKHLRANVDVLTLSATPIPRTLEMSLTGIRDLTLLNTPPAERKPILTYVGELDERAVAEAVRRELLREGQVFFVHNRVQDIERVAGTLRELVPEARVLVAHGQMDEGTLEQVVYDFSEGKADVLVCTTIIESGIDMPTVNTLVVDRADLLGLGQLHQIRGRVGRSGQRAYAYLFHPRDKVLTEEAYERLKTIGEHTELGSGFKIAMRDLEIRGAGNLLGGNQSGHIAAVGYDLYVQMVSEAVAELKGEVPKVPAEVKLEIPVDANLPADYVARDDVRLEAYRRLAAVTTDSQVDDIRAEWEDRFGPLPASAEGLVAVGRLRAESFRTGVREVVVAKGAAGGIVGPTVRISPLQLRTSQQLRLRRLHPKAVWKEEVGQLVVPVPKKVEGLDLVTWIVDLLRTLVPVEAEVLAASSS